MHMDHCVHMQNEPRINIMRAVDQKPEYHLEGLNNSGNAQVTCTVSYIHACRRFQSLSLKSELTQQVGVLWLSVTKDKLVVLIINYRDQLQPLTVAAWTLVIIIASILGPLEKRACMGMIVSAWVHVVRSFLANPNDSVMTR